MIVETERYMVRSANSNSNDLYCEQDIYPEWSAIRIFINHAAQRTGGGVDCMTRIRMVEVCDRSSSVAPPVAAGSR